MSTIPLDMTALAYELPRPHTGHVPMREQTWRNRAACAGVGVDPFFSPDPTTQHYAAARWCSWCPVTRDCAQAGAWEHGTWGGRSETRRLKERRAA